MKLDSDTCIGTYLVGFCLTHELVLKAESGSYLVMHPASKLDFIWHRNYFGWIFDDTFKLGWMLILDPVWNKCTFYTLHANQIEFDLKKVHCVVFDKILILIHLDLIWIQFIYVSAYSLHTWLPKGNNHNNIKICLC